MSDNHEDPTGTHKPQRSVGRALYNAFMGAQLQAAIQRLLGDAGPPKPAQMAEDIRREKGAARNKFRWYASPDLVDNGGGLRECNRRACQVVKGKLHPVYRP